MKTDLKLIGGHSQLGLCQKSGVEHVKHALRDLFSTNVPQAFLQIDAEKAFNSFNRDLVLTNIEKLVNHFTQPFGTRTLRRLFSSRETTSHDLLEAVESPRLLIWL